MKKFMVLMKKSGLNKSAMVQMTNSKVLVTNSEISLQNFKV